MGNSVSYSYKNDPVVRHLWTHFRAVPLLPLGLFPELKIFTLLQRRRDGFYIVGNLADLCSPGDKQKALARIIKSMTNVKTSKHGELTTIVINDGKVKGMLQLLSSASWSAIWHKAHRVKIQCLEHTLTSLDKAKRAELFKDFHLNTESLPQGRGASNITLYLVTDLIQVPSLTVTTWDKHGAVLSGTGLANGEAVTAEAGFDISQGNTISSKSKQPFTVAFRGMVCHFRQGCLEVWKETSYKPDAAAAAVGQPQDLVLEEEPEEEVFLPDEDEDMAEFVEGDNWFATMKHDGEPEETLFEVSRFQIQNTIQHL